MKDPLKTDVLLFTRFLTQSDFPKFKKKGKSDVKMYFVRNNPKDCVCERHRLKIPTFGSASKRKDIFQQQKMGYVIKSGTVSIKLTDTMFQFL